MSRKKVMVTGCYGLIAGAIHAHLSKATDVYDVHGLARRRQDSDRVAPDRVIDVPDDKFTLSDMQDLKAMVRAFEGMDVVVHMAADPSGAGGWDSILKSNIIGTYNTFEACRIAGVKRIIYASSIQASNGYRALEEPYRTIAKGDYARVPNPIPTVTAEMPVRPTNIYASSKVWGEALGRTYSDVHGLSVLCIRIGWVLAEDEPRRPEARDIWCSQRDIVGLTECCINAGEDVRYDVFYGMSNNRYLWVDLAHAKERVGFVPLDSAEDHAPLDV